jgi:hypothetical protein
MKRRSILSCASWTVLALAACVPLGTPGSPLRVLCALEGEASGEVENGDPLVLCVHSTRRPRTRDYRFSVEPPPRHRLNIAGDWHRPIPLLPSRAPSSEAWTVPLRC